MADKAPHDGVYTLDGNRFWIQVGHLLPEGAVMDGAEPVSIEPIAKPKRGSKKGAPETPDGAGPVIETPEDGAKEPETPEGAAE